MYSPFNVTYCLSPFTDRTGDSVSTIVTVLVAVPTFPAASVPQSIVTVLSATPPPAVVVPPVTVQE